MTILRLEKPIEDLLIMSSDDIFKKSHKEKTAQKETPAGSVTTPFENIFKQKITPQLQGEKESSNTGGAHNKPYHVRINCIFK